MNATQDDVATIVASLDDLEHATSEADTLSITSTPAQRRAMADGLREVCDAVLRAVACVSLDEGTIVRAMNATTRALTLARRLAPDTLSPIISQRILRNLN